MMSDYSSMMGQGFTVRVHPLYFINNKNYNVNDLIDAVEMMLILSDNDVDDEAEIEVLIMTACCTDGDNSTIVGDSQERHHHGIVIVS